MIISKGHTRLTLTPTTAQHVHRYLWWLLLEHEGYFTSFDDALLRGLIQIFKVYLQSIEQEHEDATHTHITKSPRTPAEAEEGVGEE